MADDFFDLSKDFKRTTVRTGYVNGRRADDGEFDKKVYKRPHIGKDYAIEHRMQAENQLLEASMMECETSCSRMDSIDDDLDTSIPKYKNEILDVYKKYNFDFTDGNILPINSSKYNILNTIDHNPAVILQGPTGCGKSTQVPQFILDEAKRRNQYCNIIVTQPRKIAAISLARRVCDERQWEVGTIVGFQVGLNANIHLDTRLLYCTTGILLQRLICTKSLTNYTHIILDEVHERDSDMDFLLIVIKKLMAECYNKVKIILMSATIDTMEFSEYFKTPRMGVFENAPIINVDRKRIYNVKEFYLCQLDRLKPNVDINYDEPGISDDMYNTALQLLLICGRFDENESNNDLKYKPSILVFLPGYYEIEVMVKKIQSRQNDNAEAKEFMILPLHSSITTEEQANIFLPPPPGRRKIILSTNIAESSITVPDIKYVIDFCLTKILMTDTTTNFTGLKLQWASKANCNQRSGRAGRVMNGRVYRLVSKRFYDFHMQDSAVPEILRCPLEQIVLKAKILDMGPPHSILALAMNVPNLSDIGNTILMLKSAGALYQTVGGNYDSLDGDITYMGRIMAGMPLDIRATKLIILGYLYNVFSDAVTMASCLSVRNIFSTPFGKALPAYKQKLSWADGSGSDLFAALNAYKVWKAKTHANVFQSEETERIWGKRFFVQIRAMRELSAQIREIYGRLNRHNLTDLRGNFRTSWTKRESYLILKVIIAGAFYPHYFYRATINEHEAFHVLGGLDPANTIYFKGMDPKYIGVLYEKRIKEILSDIASPSDIKLKFDNNSQRLFATFTKGDQYLGNEPHSDKQMNLANKMPGQVALEVYRACKMAKINGKHQIDVLTPSNAIKYAEKQQIGVIENGTWYPKKKKIQKLYRITPALTTKEMFGKISHHDHCGKFFFQPEETHVALKQIHDILTPEKLQPILEPSEINESEIIAAPYTNDVNDGFDHISYYRVKVIGFDREVAGIKYFTVYYIDYGNTASVKFSDLRNVMFNKELKNIPPCMFQCCLCEIQPSCFQSPQEIWTSSSRDELDKFLKTSKFFTIEIFSFVNGIASVRLKNGDLCINDILVNKGLAQYAEENYMSKANHELRERKQSSNLEENLMDNMNNEDEDLNTEDIIPPPRELCHHRINLLGPYSPLETQLFSLMKFAEYKGAKIDQQSINSVLLGTLSSSEPRKLIVAAEVGTQNNSTLIARNTTLMPSIKGFDVLMGMIFCPTMELKRDPKNIRISGALTGLGFNPKTREPFDPEHDILFKMDVEITLEDIENINALRYFMDSLLHTLPGQEYPNSLNESEKVLVLQHIMDKIRQILQKPRRSVEVVTSRNDDEWGCVKQEDAIKPETKTVIYGFRSIYPPHSGICLEEPKSGDTLRLHNNCTELHKIAQLAQMNTPFTCLLCNQTLESITELRIHLYTFLHVDREKQINYQK